MASPQVLYSAHAAESSSLQFVSENEKKKKSQELAKLAATLKLIESEIPGSKKTGKDSSEDAMIGLRTALAKLKSIKGKSLENLLQEGAKELAVLLKRAENALENLEKKIGKEIQKEKMQNASDNMWKALALPFSIVLLPLSLTIDAAIKGGFQNVHLKDLFPEKAKIKISPKLLKQLEELVLFIEELVRTESVLAKLALKSKNKAKKVEKNVALEAAVNSKGNPKGPKTSTAFENSMAKLALALQELQVQISKFSEDKANLNYKISQIQLKLSKENVQKAAKNAAKLADKLADQKFWSTFLKIATGVVTGIVDIVAIATGQVELAIIATAMYVASVTGGIKAATDALAKAVFEPMYEAFGMSKADAKTAAEITAAVVVTLVVIAVTAGIAPGSGASSAENAANEVENATTSIIKRIISFLKKGFKFVKSGLKTIGTRGGLMIMNGAQTLSQTEFATALADAIAPKKDKKQWEKAFQIAMAIVTILASLVGGGAVATSAGESLPGTLSKLLDRGVLKTMTTAIKESVTLSRMLTAMEASILLGNLTEAGAGTGSSVVTMEQAALEKGIASTNAELQIINTMANLSQSEMKADQGHDAQIIASQRNGNRTIRNLMKGEAEIARQLSQPV